MNSKDTQAILRELAVKYDMPIDDMRRICRSQFEAFIDYAASLENPTQAKRFFLTELIEFTPAKMVVKKAKAREEKKNETT